MTPSLEIGDLDRSKTDVLEVEASKPPSPKVSLKNPTLFITKEKEKKKKKSVDYGTTYAFKSVF